MRPKRRFLLPQSVAEGGCGLGGCGAICGTMHPWWCCLWWCRAASGSMSRSASSACPYMYCCLLLHLLNVSAACGAFTQQGLQPTMCSLASKCASLILAQEELAEPGERELELALPWLLDDPPLGRSFSFSTRLLPFHPKVVLQEAQRRACLASAWEGCRGPGILHALLQEMEGPACSGGFLQRMEGFAWARGSCERRILRKHRGACKKWGSMHDVSIQIP